MGDNSGYNRVPNHDDGEDEDDIQQDVFPSTACIDDSDSDEPLLDDHEPDAPPNLHDRYHMIEVISGLLGLVAVTPWNVFICATQCWNYKFRDVNNSTSHHQTPLQIYFLSYLSMANNTPYILMVLIMMFYGHKITATIRSVLSMLSLLLLMIASTVLVKVDTDTWQYQFLVIILTIVVLLSLCSSALMSSLSGVMSSFPPRIIQAMVSGQAASGLLTVLFQILSLLSHSDPLTSAMYYFIASDVLLVITFIAYLIARKTPYYRYYRKRGMQSVCLDNISERSIANRSDLVAICGKIWIHLLSTFVICFVTLSVFPSLVVLVSPREKTESPLTGELFLPIFCFMIFNLMDLMGRFGARWFALPSSKPYLLLIFSFSRVLLALGLMLCNIKPPARFYLPTVFESEYIFALLVALVGFTNGYGFTTAMFQTPSMVVPALREKTGFILTAAMGFGCLAGAISSNFLIKLL
ncbi:equilibrative nucleoside transporter 1 [Brevipalpus obovatus]|uniref:equilibrative nucleoside transporter 1 n=1 Tax=Brevipalpus obovatus TaxID=246614 RepID=UPI003D9F5B33